MRFRLTPPGVPVLLLSLALALVTLATLYTKVPFVGHYVTTHRFWMMAAAYLVLLLGVVIEGL